MFDKNKYNQKMSKTLDVFVTELSGIRTGRANASMLDLIRVEVYGQKMPINQLATITTPDPRKINIQVWDLNNVSLIDTIRSMKKKFKHLLIMKLKKLMIKFIKKKKR